MKRNLIMLAVVAMLGPTMAYGQAVDQCMELLRLSRTSFRTVISERQFQDTKLLFCDEYNRSRQDGKSANYAGSWELLSVSMGTARRTEDNVASKYCRFEGDKRKLEASFEEYINGIDPGAYGAYQACVAARQDGVHISLLGEITQDLMELRVEHTSSTGKEAAELTWSSSAPVNCYVDREGEASGSRRFSLAINERVVLVCSRDDPGTSPVLQPDYVNVVRNNGNASVSVSWPKYDHQGTPYQTLEQFRKQIDTELSNLRDKINNNVVALEISSGELASLGDKVNNSVATMETLRGEIGQRISECRVCFREVERSSQCQGAWDTCSGWSNARNTGDWTEAFRDDTDRRAGGCQYQWRLECR